MKQSHPQTQSNNDSKPERPEFAVSPDNPTLFMTDAEIRARLATVWENLRGLGSLKPTPVWENYRDDVSFLLNVLAARCPALVPDRSETT